MPNQRIFPHFNRLNHLLLYYGQAKILYHNDVHAKVRKLRSLMFACYGYYYTKIHLNNLLIIIEYISVEAIHIFIDLNVLRATLSPLND